jgi:hypothetical protein
MKHKLALFLSLGLTTSIQAQLLDMLSFSELLVQPDTFLNGADGTQEFYADDWTIPVHYDAQNFYWASGTAVSSMRDTSDGSYLNLYSAYFHDTAMNAYGIANLGAEELHLTYNVITDVVTSYLSINITNTTYALHSMRNGDQFSKKFGGPSGNDPDYFFIRFYSGSDSLDFYLADFRFSNDSLDYIVDDWVTVDMSSLGVVEGGLRARLFSSDTGAFGINTPLFFAYDELVTHGSYGVADGADQAAPRIFSDGTMIHVQGAQVDEIVVYNALGQILFNGAGHQAGQISLPATVQPLLIQVRHEQHVWTSKIIH